MILNGNTWFFCLKCKCKFTGKVGFFNKTHNTPDHTDPNPSASDQGTAPGSAPAASHTPSADVNADISVPIVPSLSATAGEDEVDPAPAGLVWDGAYNSAVHEEGVWMAAVDDPIDESIRSRSPNMFDEDWEACDEYHYKKALKEDPDFLRDCAMMAETELAAEASDSVEEVEELDLNNLLFEDSVEELEFAQIFANCNSCGDIGVLEKDCWCGGCFNISRDPNVFVDQVLESAARDNQVLESAARDTVSPGGWTPAGSRPVVSTEPAAPAVPWSDIVSSGGWNPAGSVVSTEPAAPAAPWGLNALGEPAACPQYFCASTGEPLSPGDVGPKPAVDGEEPESRLCTGCGSIDHFFQTPPFKCLCGSLNSQPATDDWFGIALDPKPPMNNANAA
jgi:hypothetical protein